MKKILLIATVFLLSSCMKLESEITLDANGIASSRASIDMSKFITLISAFGTGAESAGINKNLCLDENFSGGLYESLSQEKNPLSNVKCTSLGDYKALVEGVQDYKNKKGVLFLSGVTVVDMLALGDEDRVPKSGSDDISGMNAEDLGFTILQSYTLPGKIAYKEAGTLSGSSTVNINLLDPKVLNKQSLIVISTESGKRLTPREINAYKLKLRKHNRSVR